MATWTSHKRAFDDVVRLRRPKTFFEWGGGEGTTQWAKEAGFERHVVIEHDKEWFDKIDVYEKYLRKLGNRYVGTLHDLDRDWDFISIDGRMRNACCQAARTNLSEKGIVMIHDTYREKYWHGIRIFKYIISYTEEDTVLMSNVPFREWE